MKDATTTNGAGGIMGAIRDYGAYRRTIRELAWLSDSDLSDIGIGRSDIRSAAKAFTYRR